MWLVGKSPPEADFFQARRSAGFSETVELAKLPAGFRLLAAFLDARLLIVFTTLQFSFNSVDLQFFLQLANGIFEISPNFNINHLGLRRYKKFFLRQMREKNAINACDQLCVTKKIPLARYMEPWIHRGVCSPPAPLSVISNT